MSQKRLLEEQLQPEAKEEETKSARKPPTAKGNSKPLTSAKPARTSNDETGETFLTDMLFKGRPPSKPNLRKETPKSLNSRKGDTSEKKEIDQSEYDPDEYRDMVFDFDQSKALVQMADDFLNPQLAKGYEEEEK